MKVATKQIEDFDRIIVKHRSAEGSIVERLSTSKNTLGIILSGERYIQMNDKTLRLPKGSLFFMGQGVHFVEDVSSKDAPFEQLAFRFSADQLQRVVKLFESEILSEQIKLRRVDKSSKFGECNVSGVMPRKEIVNFFTSVDNHYSYSGFVNDRVAEELKLIELIYTIMKYDDSDILQRLILTLDSDRANFEQVIYHNIFEDKRIKELASECNRSCTTFKKDFSRHFGVSPHQWYQRQRISYASMLLATTNKSIGEIGTTCLFPNTSHFIKLFKRTYGVTPAVYRSQCA